MENMDGKMVMPGDELAHAEEFAPGPNTYEEGCMVKASTLGTAHLDVEERMAFVEPTNPIVELEEGDTVICYVKDIRKTVAVVELIKVAGKERTLSSRSDGTIHVSKVSPDYIENINEELQLRDVVRAKVIRTGPQVQLSTEDEDMGVLKSICTVCSQPLKLKSGRLFCEQCERSLRRKTASDYGSGQELAEDLML